MGLLSLNLRRLQVLSIIILSHLLENWHQNLIPPFVPHRFFPPVSHHFSFYEITQTELSETFNSLTNSHARDIYGLNMHFF